MEELCRISYLVVSVALSISLANSEMKNSLEQELTINCNSNEYFCNDLNDTCIPGERFCDGIVDCLNGADEWYFPDVDGVPCTPKYVGNYTLFDTCMLTDWWLCDGIRGQCESDTDERCWSSSNNCTIHQNKLCDGKVDCIDGEDEKDCQYFICEAASQAYDDYNFTSAPYYINISERFLCNGINDCANQVDECLLTCPHACMCKVNYEDCGNGSFCEVEDQPQCMLCWNDSSYIYAQECDGKRDCEDGSDESNCGDFTCTNGNIVPRRKTCNYVDDCGDSSDECDCSDYFKVFTCRNSRCIREISLCDGRDDCGDSSDECLAKCPPRNKFFCSSGDCIAKTLFCDAIDDCADASDEIPATGFEIFNSSSKIIPCSNADNQNTKTCLLFQEEWFCDLADHCEDRADECMDECPLSFRCDDDKCLNIDSFCDGNPDCDDGSDEADPFEDPDSIACRNIMDVSNKTCSLRSDHDWVCDGMNHCTSRADECSSSCIHSYMCKSGQCITRDKVCDGRADCDDESDEYSSDGNTFLCARRRRGLRRTCTLPITITFDDSHDCDRDSDMGGKFYSSRLDDKIADYNAMIRVNEELPDNFFRCLGESLVIPGFKFCDGIFDCPLLSDECFCKDSPPICQLMFTAPANDLGCSVGEISCSVETKCITRRQICDDNIDCIDGVDEKYCDNDVGPCSRDGKTTCNTVPCVEKTMASDCDGIPECKDFSDECSDRCKNDVNNGTLPEFCDHVAEFRVQVSDDKSLRVSTYSCGNGYKQLQGPSVCDGRKLDCEDGSDEMHCPNRIYCDDVIKAYNDTGYVSRNFSQHKPWGAIHIAKDQVCDGKIDCRGAEDELNCEQHYYCENKQPLFVPKRAVTDGKIDCSDGSDECPASTFGSDAFASRENMLRSWILRMMVWVMGILSTVGNFVVLIETLYESYRPGKRKFAAKRPFAKVHHILVINLAMADLLMGVYLISLGVQVAKTSKKYCKADKQWRTSSDCIALGTLTVVSSITSILILAIMTTYRLLAVLRPFHCQKFSTVKTILFAIFAWITAILLGFLPRMVTLSDYFITEVWVDNNRLFQRDTISPSDLRRILDLIQIYYNDYNRTLTEKEYFVGGDVDWTHLSHHLEETFGNDVIRGCFGYYSVHSVCLPKLFVTTDDVAWEYSVMLVSFIFATFLYIVIAYITIYARSRSTGTSNNTRQTQIHRKITYVVASDIVCWVPICFMAYLTLAKFPVSDQIYAVAAIILLPINSALNPLLYSNVIQRIAKKLWEICTRKNREGGNTALSPKLSMTTRGLTTRCSSRRVKYNNAKRAIICDINVQTNDNTKSNHTSNGDLVDKRRQSEELVESIYDNCL